MFSAGKFFLVRLQCKRGGHYPHGSGYPSSSSFLLQSPAMCMYVCVCVCLVASDICISPQKVALSKPLCSPRSCSLLNGIFWRAIYTHFKYLGFGETGSMAESWHKTSWEFRIHFLVKYLFIKAVFRWWLKNVLYGMLQIPGRLHKLTQLLANSFALEDYSESASVCSSQKVHTGCDTMTRSHTEKQ